MWFGQSFRARVGLALVGTAGGYALWALVRHHDLADAQPQRYLFLAAFSVVFFHSALMMIGPLRLRRAVPSAFVFGLVLAGLFTWASTKFDQLDAFIGSPQRLAAAAVLALVPLPYIIAANGPGWRHYPTLFSQAWSLVVRALGAWIFTGAVWLLVFLSNALLSLVGVRAITHFLELEGMPWAFTGAIFGLGLAVVNEFTDYISPYLTLRLLRLLVPVVLAVSVVFLVALPLHGLSIFFGGISSAQTLLAITLGSACLITVDLGEKDEDAEDAPVMMRMTQALALILPVLAGLGAWAVWQRVVQYGWTPSRVTAGILAASALAYGILYALAVLRGRGWQARIRSGNTILALVVLAVVALAFTPLLNAQRISAKSQVSRYLNGQSTLADLDVAALATEWGRPGRAAFEKLQALARKPGEEALRDRLAAATSVERDREASRKALADELRKLLPVRPERQVEGHAKVLSALLRSASATELRDWLNACRRNLSGGQPGCVLLTGRFLPDEGGEQALLLYRTPTGALRREAVVLDPSQGLLRSQSADYAAPGSPPLDASALIASVLDGKAEIAPARLNALRIGDHQIIILPGTR